MIDFLWGAAAMGFAIAGLIFLRFWKESRDRLFLLFAIAFFVLAGNRVLLEHLHENNEHNPELYLVRLLAYLILLSAILDKNLRPPK
jgi:hypothetical protein